ncbi:hypothetical protein ACO0K2_17345 [Undibacterium sp. MH2W]|uniref:hypothetical protein n=1 Tax=Undibacterium sp. MH2W TaxID=3413044 RepID=UPI003BF40248
MIRFLLIFFFFSTLSYADDREPPKFCVKDKVDKILDGGAYIISVKGLAYQFLGQDFIDQTKWRRGQSIEVCNEVNPDLSDTTKLFKITNLKRKESLVVMSIDRELISESLHK